MLGVVPIFVLEDQASVDTFLCLSLNLIVIVYVSCDPRTQASA